MTRTEALAGRMGSGPAGRQWLGRDEEREDLGWCPGFCFIWVLGLGGHQCLGPQDESDTSMRMFLASRTSPDLHPFCGDIELRVGCSLGHRGVKTL